MCKDNKRPLSPDDTKKSRKSGKQSPLPSQQMLQHAEPANDTRLEPPTADIITDSTNFQLSVDLDRDVEDAKHLLVQFNPNRVVATLSSCQDFAARAKGKLPNPELCRQDWLKDLVRKVHHECDDLSWCVSDFVVQTDEARSKLVLLRHDVMSLLSAGLKALQKVKVFNEPWNYGDIEQQVDNVDERYRQVVMQIDSKFDEVKATLNRNQGKHISEMCLRIRGQETLQAAVDHNQTERLRRVAESRKKGAYYKAQTDFITSEITLLNSQQTCLSEAERSLLQQQQEVSTEIRKLKNNNEKEVENVLKEFTTKQEEVGRMVSQVQSPSDIATYRRLSRDINDQIVCASKAQEQVDEITSGSGQPSPPAQPVLMHFVLVVDESASMQRNSCANLKQAQSAISSLSTARIPFTRDQVSLVVFSSQKEVVVYNKEWQDVHNYCTGKKPHFPQQFLTSVTGRGGDPPNFMMAFDAANDLICSARAKKGMRMDTVLLVFTDTSSSFTDAHLDIAKTTCSSGHAFGNFKGFLVSVNDVSGENELKANALLAALNSGLPGFNDIEDNLQSFFTTPKELLRKIRAVEDLTGDASALERLRFKRANERLDEMQALLNLKKKDMAEKQKHAKRYAETQLEELARQKNISVIQKREHLKYLSSFLTERASEVEAELKNVRDALTHVRQNLATAEENLAVNSGKAQDYTKELESTEAYYSEVYNERSRADRVKMDDMLGNFDAPQLLAELEPANRIFQESRENLIRAMNTFSAATNPIKNLVLVLKQSAKIKIHPKSKDGKVLESYRRKTVGLNSSMPMHEKLLAIIQHICKDEAKEPIKNVAKFLSISDFITAVERLDEAQEEKDSARASEKAEEARAGLQQTLCDGLVQVDRSIAIGRASLEKLQDNLRQLKKNLTELSNEPDDEDRDERRQRQEDMREKRKEIADKQKEIRDAERELNETIRGSYGQEMIITGMVLKDITSVYHSIQLEHGMHDAEMQLKNIYTFFNTALTDFQEQADNMALTYSRGRV